MENNYAWFKRKIRFLVNNNFVCKIFMRLYYVFEELIWLLVCVGLLVVILKLFLLPF